jgi:hypothetical protein
MPSSPRGTAGAAQTEFLEALRLEPNNARALAGLSELAVAGHYRFPDEQLQHLRALLVSFCSLDWDEHSRKRGRRKETPNESRNLRAGVVLYSQSLGRGRRWAASSRRRAGPGLAVVFDTGRIFLQPLRIGPTFLISPGFSLDFLLRSAAEPHSIVSRNT